MPDLAYLEPDEVCQHRLEKVFKANKTSHRLLMFFNLSRCTIDRGSGVNRKFLEQMRDELFDSHGAPPYGTAAKLAAQVKKVQEISTFPAFLAIMGIRDIPGEAVLTKFLRSCVTDSMAKGYSVQGCTQEAAKAIRENGGRSEGILVKSFFPYQRRRRTGGRYTVSLWRTESGER